MGQFHNDGFDFGRDDTDFREDRFAVLLSKLLVLQFMHDFSTPEDTFLSTLTG